MIVVGAGILGGVAVPTILRMLWNVTIDATLGTIPFAGDAFDFVNKTNTRNLNLIHADLADRKGTSRRSAIVLTAWFAGVTTVVVTLIVIQLLVIVWILSKIF